MRLFIGVMRVGIACKHIAVGDPILDSNAYSEGVTSGINHCLEVAGRIHPVRDCFLGDRLIPGNSKHSQIRAKPVGISAGHGCLTLKLTVVRAEHLGRADLRGIHQGLIDLKSRNAVLLADLIDKSNHFLPDIHVCGKIRGRGVARCFLARACHNECKPPLAAVGPGDRHGCGAGRMGHGHPVAGDLLHSNDGCGTGGHGDILTSISDDQPAPVTNCQSIALVTTDGNSGGRHTGIGGGGVHLETLKSTCFPASRSLT